MDFKAKAKALADEYFNENILVGLAGVIVEPNDHSFPFSFGKRIVKGDADFSTATPVPIGSTTKLLTATLTMQCQKTGELKLDQSIAEFFPDSDYLSRHFAGAKVIDLLTHTSGLPRDLRGQYFETGIFPNAHDLIKEMEIQNTRPVARSIYRYSNLGYALLGIIIERAAQQPIDKLFQDRIFARLDSEGIYSTPPSDYSTHTRGYRYNIDLKCQVEQPLYQLGSYFPTGGIYASAEALASFAQALVTKNSPLGLDAEDLRRMFSIYFLNESWTAGAAIGWRSIKLRDSQIFTQSGSIPGFSSSILISPERQQAIVLVSNSDGFLFPLGEGLWDLMSQTRQVPATPKHPNLREYEGDFYWLDSSRRMTFKINDDGYLSIPGLSYKPLVDDLTFVPTDSPDVFKIKGGLHDGEIAAFLRSESGALCGLWLGGMRLVKVNSN